MEIPADIVVYTKPECPLCDEGLHHVEALARRHGLRVRKVDIEGDESLFYRYRYRIPVVEYAGEELGWGRLDPDALLEAWQRVADRG